MLGLRSSERDGEAGAVSCSCSKPEASGLISSANALIRKRPFYRGLLLIFGKLANNPSLLISGDRSAARASFQGTSTSASNQHFPRFHNSSTMSFASGKSLAILALGSARVVSRSAGRPMSLSQPALRTGHVSSAWLQRVIDIGEGG